MYSQFEESKRNNNNSYKYLSIISLDELNELIKVMNSNISKFDKGNKIAHNPIMHSIHRIRDNNFKNLCFPYIASKQTRVVI